MEKKEKKSDQSPFWASVATSSAMYLGNFTRNKKGLAVQYNISL